jgi:predicted amidohydrolase
MAMIYRNNNCSLLMYPGAFNLTTGPAHWELLLRSRAVDNQLFVAGKKNGRIKRINFYFFNCFLQRYLTSS